MSGVWAELMSDDEVRATLPLLASTRSRLHLAVPAKRIGDEQLASLTREAVSVGVEVMAWPLLPMTDGYWISEDNVEATERAIDSLLRWRARPAGAAFDGVSFDLEPHYVHSEALRRSAARASTRFFALLSNHVNPAAHGRARDDLCRVVDRVRAAGLHTHAVTYPVVLDQPEGCHALEDALGIVVTGIEWDEVSFMVYQTVLAQLTGIWFGPGLVHSYATDAVRRHGPRAGLDLGVVGDFGVGLDAGRRYPNAQTLAADAASARAAGVSCDRLRVYGLKGIAQQADAAAWLDWPEAEAPQSEDDRAARGLRNAITVLARALAR